MVTKRTPPKTKNTKTKAKPTVKKSPPPPVKPKPKKKAAPKKNGRPSKYTKALAARICASIAAGKSLRTICKAENMPAISTFLGWVDEDKDGLSEHYARACDARALLFAEELVDIADDSVNDFVETEKGRVFDGEAVQRAKLRVDTRKWLLSKLLPKKYGEKLDINHGGKVDVKPLSAFYGSDSKED